MQRLALRQIAAINGRRRWLRTVVATVIALSLFSKKGWADLMSTVRPNGVTAQAFERSVVDLTFAPVSPRVLK
jgi:hypothetical protein